MALFAIRTQADNVSAPIPTPLSPENQSTLSLAASREQITGLRDEVDKASKLFDSADKPDASNAEVQKPWASYSKIFDVDLPKIMSLLVQDPASSNSFNTLIWITNNKRMFRNRIPTAPEIEAIRMLGQFHATNSGVAVLCAKIGRKWDWHWDEHELFDFVIAVGQKNPDRIIRGQAIFSLARLNRAKGQFLSDFENKLTKIPGSAGKQTIQPEDLEIAETENSAAVLDKAVRLFGEVTTNYGDCPYVRATPSHRPGTTLRDEASNNLYELRNLAIGKTAPDLAGAAVDGKPINLSDYRGKVVVLSFWASWCGPCMAMIPHERALAERMTGKPFALIGVNGDSSTRDALRAIDKEKMTWPSFSSGDQGPFGSIPTKWNVKNWPTVFILDAKGVIRLRFMGVQNKQLDYAVDQLLAEMEKNP